MKANAPEKVYLHLTTGSHVLNGKCYEYKPAKIRFDDKIIEYTRTDAFIEKACEYWYQYNRDIVKKGCKAFTVNVEDFKKYMEG